MTDGTLWTIVGLIVGMLATSVSAVVVSRARGRERRRAAEHEAVSMRDARLRAELQLLEVKAGDLRTQIEELEGRRAHLLVEVQAAREGSDPATAPAQGPVRRANHPSELTRRLHEAGDGHVIAFPFPTSEQRN